MASSRVCRDIVQGQGTLARRIISPRFLHAFVLFHGIKLISQKGIIYTNIDWKWYLKEELSSRLILTIHCVLRLSSNTIQTAVNNHHALLFVSSWCKDKWNYISDWSQSHTLYIGCCQGIRGNIDFDPLDGIDIGDLVYLVAYSFTGGSAPICLAEADVDASLGLDIGDLVYMVAYSFTGGPPPVSCE